MRLGGALSFKRVNLFYRFASNQLANILQYKWSIYLHCHILSWRLNSRFVFWRVYPLTTKLAIQDNFWLIKESDKVFLLFNLFISVFTLLITTGWCERKLSDEDYSPFSSLRRFCFQGGSDINKNCALPHIFQKIC